MDTTVHVRSRSHLTIALAAGAVFALGLGLRQFSMHPAQVLAVKQEVLRTNLSSVRLLARRMLRVADRERMRSMLERLNAD